jgi:hypothetical protein
LHGRFHSQPGGAQILARRAHVADQD